MAKKKTTKAAKRKKATRPKPGELFEKHDEKTRAVVKAAEELVDARSEAALAKETVDDARDKLIELMRDAKLKEIRIDGFELQRTEETKPKISIKRLKMDAPEGASEGGTPF